MKPQPDPQDVAVAVARSIAEDGDISLLTDKTIRPEKPVSEMKAEFLEGVTDLKERKRIQQMSPDDFRAMQKAVFDDGGEATPA